MSYLTEAFKQMELLESEQFTFDKDGAAKLANFLDDDMLNDIEAIIDPEAETKEELKDSYMGNVICRCPICRSLIYRDPEDIKVDEEEQLANLEEPCPYCFEHGGFEIVGQVAPYEEVTVETTGDKDVDIEVDGEKVEIEDTEDEELNEGIFDKFKKKDAPKTRGMFDKRYGLYDRAGNLRYGPFENDVLAEIELKNISKRSDKLFNELTVRELTEDDYAKHVKESLDESLEEGIVDKVKGIFKKSSSTSNGDTKWAVMDNKTGETVLNNVSEQEAQEYVKKQPSADNFDVLPIKESLTEASIYDKLVNAFPELADDSMGEVRSKRRHARDNEDIEDSQRFPVEGTNQRNLMEKRCAKRRHTRDNEDLEDSQRYPIESPVGTKGLKENVEEESETAKRDPKARLMSKRRHARDNEDIEDSQRYPIESPAPAQTGLKESMEDISITTDDQVIKVKATPRADKETIQPVEDETKDVIEAPIEEEVPEDMPTEDQDVEIEEFDEESFDNLGESYLRQVYENVSGFKTSDVQSTTNKIIVEGIISFNSGKKAKTKFMFEAKDATKSGKLRFTGLNENISKNKKAFTLTGILKENKLISESLNYNYSAQAENGKSKRLYGTVRR